MNGKAERSDLKKGDKVVLMENTSDGLLNVWYFGRHAEVVSETRGCDQSDFVIVQLLDKTRKRLEWKKDCMCRLEEMRQHDANVVEQAKKRNYAGREIFVEQVAKKMSVGHELAIPGPGISVGAARAAHFARETTEVQHDVSSMRICNDLQPQAEDAHFVIRHTDDAVIANRSLSPSIHSLKSLHIQFACFDIPFDCAVILGGAVKACQALEKLTLSGLSAPPGKPSPLHDSDPQDKCFRVVSGSLRHLDVSLMATGTFVSCLCPMLETFVSRVTVATDRSGKHRRYFKANGSLPSLSRQQFDFIRSKAMDEMARNDNTIALEDGMKTLKVQAELVPCVGLNIPGHCTCKVINFREISDWESYCSMTAMVQACQSLCGFV